MNAVGEWSTSRMDLRLYQCKDESCQNRVVDDVCGSVVAFVVILEFFFVCALNVRQISSRTGIWRWKLIAADNRPNIDCLEQVFAVLRPGGVVVAVEARKDRLFVLEELIDGVGFVRHRFLIVRYRWFVQQKGPRAHNLLKKGFLSGVRQAYLRMN